MGLFKKASSLVAVLFLGWLSVSYAQSSKYVADEVPGIDLTALSSEVETVFNWKRDRCADDFIPDSPARAYRRNDGSLVVIAAHFRNSVFEGQSFDNLRPNCDVTSRGEENADPSAFDDRFWIQGIVPAPDGKLVVLLSHDFTGRRHAGKCLESIVTKSLCWYGSILLGSGDESTFSFTILPKNRRIIAAASKPFNPAMVESRTGFFTTTNVVEWNGYYYFLSWGEDRPFAGNCLFRTKTNSPYGPWMALRKGTFSKEFRNPFVGGSDQPGPPCDRIEKLPTPLRSVVKLNQNQLFVGVYALKDGMYYATSKDLVHWSERKLLFAGKPWNMRGGACGVFYEYPSLIDHKSESKIFDTASSDIYLYLMRYDLTSCRGSLDRDLVRIKLTLGQSATVSQVDAVVRSD